MYQEKAFMVVTTTLKLEALARKITAISCKKEVKMKANVAFKYKGKFRL